MPCDRTGGRAIPVEAQDRPAADLVRRSSREQSVWKVECGRSRWGRAHDRGNNEAQINEQRGAHPLVLETAASPPPQDRWLPSNENEPRGIGRLTRRNLGDLRDKTYLLRNSIPGTYFGAQFLTGGSALPTRVSSDGAVEIEHVLERVGGSSDAAA
jgi:hypothetical protein